MNFVKFLEKHFCRTSPSNDFPHDAIFFSFLQISEVCSLNQFIWWSNSKLGEGICKPVQSYVVTEISGGKFIVKSWQHKNQLRYSKSWRSGRKRGFEKFVKVGKLSFYVMGDREVFTYLKNKK